MIINFVPNFVQITHNWRQTVTLPVCTFILQFWKLDKLESSLFLHNLYTIPEIFVRTFDTTAT